MSFNSSPSSSNSGGYKTSTPPGWDGDRFITPSGTAYDTGTIGFAWNTGHSDCADDDN
jgi:hypothetical protein